MDLVVKETCQKISEELGLPFDVVKEIVYHQFEFTRKVMSSAKKNDPESFKTIQWQYLGKMAVREFKVEEYKKRADEKSGT